MFDLIGFLIVLIGDKSLQLDILLTVRITRRLVHEQGPLIIVHQIVVLVVILDLAALALLQVEALVVVVFAGLFTDEELQLVLGFRGEVFEACGVLLLELLLFVGLLQIIPCINVAHFHIVGCLCLFLHRLLSIVLLIDIVVLLPCILQRQLKVNEILHVKLIVFGSLLIHVQLFKHFDQINPLENQLEQSHMSDRGALLAQRVSLAIVHKETFQRFDISVNILFRRANDDSLIDADEVLHKVAYKLHKDVV